MQEGYHFIYAYHGRYFSFLFIEIQDQTLFSLWYLELLLHPVVSVDAGVGAGVPVYGLAHLIEQLRGLLGEGTGGVELFGHVLLVVAVVAVVVLAGPADQPNSLENWKQAWINPVSLCDIPSYLNSLTIVAGDVLIDPGEP